MTRSDTWKTWAIVIGLLIFTGFASAAWLYLSSQEDDEQVSEVSGIETSMEPVVVSVGDYVLGDELLAIPVINDNIEGMQINPWLVVAAAFGLIALLVGGMGFALAIISWLTSRQVTKVYTDEAYQMAVTELSQRESERLKGIQGTRPTAAPVAPQRRLRWSVIITALLILILVWITGLLFGIAFFGDTSIEIAGLEISAVALFNVTLAAITIVVLALVIRAREPSELDSSRTDNNPVNWSYVWIILSGALILGLGAGLAIAMTSLPAN